MSSPQNARSTTHGGRFYVFGRGERYWSVTTILKALPKDALKFWAARVVAEFAVDRSKTWFTMKREEAIDWLKREPLRFTGERADFGSAVHRAAEHYALGAPLGGEEWGEEERSAMGHFLDWCDTFAPTFELTEASVYNRTQKYAGTLDAIVTIPLELLGTVGHPWHSPTIEEAGKVRLLIDYKTGGDVEEGKGVYPEVALQLAAYAHAEFVGLPNGLEAPLPSVDGAAVLQVNAGGWRLVPVDALDPKVFKSFLYVREVFRWLEETSKEVLGTPIMAGPGTREVILDETEAPK